MISKPINDKQVLRIKIFFETIDKKMLIDSLNQTIHQCTYQYDMMNYPYYYIFFQFNYSPKYIFNGITPLFKIPRFIKNFISITTNATNFIDLLFSVINSTNGRLSDDAKKILLIYATKFCNNSSYDNFFINDLKQECYYKLFCLGADHINHSAVKKILDFLLTNKWNINRYIYIFPLQSDCTISQWFEEELDEKKDYQSSDEHICDKSINDQSNSNNIRGSLLHFLTLFPDYVIIQWLLLNGADPDLKTTNSKRHHLTGDKTPLELLVEYYYGCYHANYDLSKYSDFVNNLKVLIEVTNRKVLFKSPNIFQKLCYMEQSNAITELINAIPWMKSDQDILNNILGFSIYESRGSQRLQKLLVQMGANPLGFYSLTVNDSIVRSRTPIIVTELINKSYNEGFLIDDYPEFDPDIIINEDYNFFQSMCQFNGKSLFEIMVKSDNYDYVKHLLKQKKFEKTKVTVIKFIQEILDVDNRISDDSENKNSFLFDYNHIRLFINIIVPIIEEYYEDRLDNNELFLLFKQMEDSISKLFRLFFTHTNSFDFSSKIINRVPQVLFKKFFHPSMIKELYLNELDLLKSDVSKKPDQIRRCLVNTIKEILLMNILSANDIINYQQLLKCDRLLQSWKLHSGITMFAIVLAYKMEYLRIKPDIMNSCAHFLLLTKELPIELVHLIINKIACSNEEFLCYSTDSFKTYFMSIL
jgi:hypothetical protein